MKRALESSPFTLLAKPCPPKLFVETVRRICHDIQPIPQKNKSLPLTSGAASKTMSRTNAERETINSDQTTASRTR
jgi:hypothetical protein